jgi:signal transduction histidine kinase
MSITALQKQSPVHDDAPAENPDPVNILVVDDLPEKIFVYKTILEDLNQNLITASSGEEALRLVLRHEFAVILLDVNMPGMDGFETATLIRNRKKSSRTPIIFLTAFTDELNAAQGYASGAVDYLPTPVVPEILKTKVRVFIELFQMRQQAAVQAEERAKRAAAEQSARRKDEFLAMLAHELRNPLAPLHNALHVLKRPDVTPEIAQEAHEMMERQLSHMVRLVNDLMDVSRITRGKIELKRGNVFLEKILQGAVETVRPLISERQHSLILKMPHKSTLVSADVVRLAQVFSNLLNNAAKYTDPGGRITISVEESGQSVFISVQDTGVGIPADKLSEVFDLFMQVDNSISRSQGGLGIGLTLVKRLVELQGGTIKAESNGLGKGSTFIITLPLAEEQDDTAPQEQASPQPGKGPSFKILVVDDNKESAKTLGWMLEYMGHEIVLAFDGPSAIEMAEEHRPDMILLDIGLPGMSGYEVCSHLRRNPKLQGTVFVAQTGWGQAEHRRRSEEAGFDHHLVKPIQAQTLYQILESMQQDKKAV